MAHCFTYKLAPLTRLTCPRTPNLSGIRRCSTYLCTDECRANDRHAHAEGPVETASAPPGAGTLRNRPCNHPRMIHPPPVGYSRQPCRRRLRRSRAPVLGGCGHRRPDPGLGPGRILVRGDAALQSEWPLHIATTTCVLIDGDKDSSRSRICLESLPILLSDLVRVHPGRPAAFPTATGWDEELRARTASVRLPRPGHSESSFSTDPFVCPIMLRHRYR